MISIINSTLLQNHHLAGLTVVTRLQAIEVYSTSYLLTEVIPTIPVGCFAFSFIDCSMVMSKFNSSYQTTRGINPETDIGILS